MSRNALVAAGIGVVVVLTVVLGVRALGGIVRRPEGAAERFLQAASRRSARDRATATRYGPADIAHELVAFRRDKADSDFFTRIEVGRALRSGDQATVPALVERNDAAKTTQRLAVLLVRAAGAEPRSWKVRAIGVRGPGQGRVPSEGGPKPVSAPLGTWLAGLAIGLGLTVVAELVLRAVGRGTGPASAVAD